ncbi:Rieske 2Fe-2S domain-containing protein [Moorena producens]|uniref:Rieske 2Fe-2S domain-containing protein n=1 Tax=Moorena producens TaxID=1155739 RepID=UPI003C775F51
MTANTQVSRFPFTPFANGWFRVAYSDELSFGEVKPLHYFGKELVLFRTEQGTPHVFDAYCPHLGTHLGHGGTVKGEVLRCPFHGWCFNTDGQCVDIPYGNKIPSKAAISPWPVRELNGVIMVYYDGEGKLPTWEIPPLPELTSSEWIPFKVVSRRKIRSHLQETKENLIDVGHLYGTHLVNSVESGTLHIDNQVLKWSYSASSKNIPSSPETKAYIEQTLYGLGHIVHRYHVKMPFEYEYMVVFYDTPIDGEYLDYNYLFSLKKLPSEEMTAAVADQTLQVFHQEADKDIPLWENKLYLTNPLMCEGDGPIIKFRRWASQFYSNAPVKSQV